MTSQQVVGNYQRNNSNSPLAGLCVIEMAAIGPVPLAGQLLADMGADVLTIERTSTNLDKGDVNQRNKQFITLDLKSSQGNSTVKRLINKADVLIEGFRPGVMERLELGPTDFEQSNPQLIYARMTGWGQSGPLANTAGHDINYLALTGLLNAMGRSGEPPVPPLNMVADYGGGTMFLLFGVLSALYERSNSGQGQVIDVAMVDGVPAMMSLLYTLLGKSQWNTQRESNWLDGGAPYYRCYETSDGKYLSVGALEPAFFSQFVRLAGLPSSDCQLREDRDQWPLMRERYAAHFKSQTLSFWMGLFDGTDACVAPVLDFHEAAKHPHNSSRGTYSEANGILQAAAAPRFSRSTTREPLQTTSSRAEARQLLRHFGFGETECDELMGSMQLES